MISVHATPIDRAKKAKAAGVWLLFLLACGGTYFLSNRLQSGTDNAASALLAHVPSTEIDLYQGRATPISATIPRDSAVLFMVKDASYHDIAKERTDQNEARLESGQIGESESYSLVFHRAGTYSFYDLLNQDIRATVTVQ